MLEKLPDAAAKKAVAPALKKVAKRVHAFTMARVPVDTGNLKAAMAKQNKPRRQRSRKAIIFNLDLPERHLLGIAPDSPYYPPAYVEYGYSHTSGVHVPARPFIRPATDENIDLLHGMMRHDIRKGIEREAAKLGKRK